MQTINPGRLAAIIAKLGKPTSRSQRRKIGVYPKRGSDIGMPNPESSPSEYDAITVQLAAVEHRASGLTISFEWQIVF